VSFLEIALALISVVCVALGTSLPTSTSLTDTINTVQILRALRPLKSLTLLPSLMTYLEACFKVFYKIIATVMVLLMVLMVLAIVAWYLIGDALLYRCVPNLDYLTNPTPSVMDNPYYNIVGIDFYYSRYNLNFCGQSQSCEEGLSCQKLQDLVWLAIPADFSTPWRALISNMSFLTMRGWQNVFWAIAMSTQSSIAFGLFAFLSIVGTLMIINMFPAIFMASLQTEAESYQKLLWLQVYPKSLETVSEIDIMIWGEKNAKQLEIKAVEKTDFSLPTRLYHLLWKKYDIASYKSAMKKIEANTLASLAQDPDSMNSEINVGVIPWRPLVPRCRAWDIIRHVIIPDNSYFNMSMIAMIFVNIIILSLDAPGKSQAVSEVVFYGNIVCTSIFGVELLTKILLLGPFVYFDSIFNILDFVLVILGIVQYFENVPKFVTNLRVIKLLLLARLQMILKLRD